MDNFEQTMSSIGRKNTWNPVAMMDKAIASYSRLFEVVKNAFRGYMHQHSIALYSERQQLERYCQRLARSHGMANRKVCATPGIQPDHAAVLLAKRRPLHHAG